MKKVVLASASPRRSGLLRQIGIDFKVITSEIEEVLDQDILPEELVQRLSFQKAYDVAEKLRKIGEEPCLVIGADTVVVSERVLGKPDNRFQALDMLKSISGRWHDVLTGVTVIDTESCKSMSSFERTRVKMRDLSDMEIDAYIATGEPMDKAGAYGVQGIGAVLVERIEGCYFNVVGLPLVRLVAMLEDFGVKVLHM